MSASPFRRPATSALLMRSCTGDRAGMHALVPVACLSTALARSSPTPPQRYTSSTSSIRPLPRGVAYSDRRSPAAAMATVLCSPFCYDLFLRSSSLPPIEPEHVLSRLQSTGRILRAGLCPVRSVGCKLFTCLAAPAGSGRLARRLRPAAAARGIGRAHRPLAHMRCHSTSGNTRN